MNNILLEHKLNRLNYKRLSIFVTLALFIHGAFLLFLFDYFISVGVLSWLFLGANIAMGIYLLYLKNGEKSQAKNFRWVIQVFIGSVLCWAAAIAQIHVDIDGYVSAYVVAVLIMSFAVYNPPVYTAIIYGFAYLFYFIFFLIFRGFDNNLEITAAISAFIFTLAGFGVSYNIYRSTIRDLAYTNLIAAKNAELTQLNETLNILNKQLEEAATIDFLTGLANRREFDRRYKKEWVASFRHQHKISVIMMDIDFFKQYNDLYGHPQGDECLKFIADVIESSLTRPHDYAFRYGGEEFVAILADTDTKGAVSVCQKIQTALQQRAIPHEASTISKYVTLSYGLATFVPTSNQEDGSFLYQWADEALYEAKRNGRNAIAIFDPLQRKSKLLLGRGQF